MTAHEHTRTLFDPGMFEHDDPEPIVPMDLELEQDRIRAHQTGADRDDLPLPLLPPGLLEGFGLW